MYVRNKEPLLLADVIRTKILCSGPHHSYDYKVSLAFFLLFPFQIWLLDSGVAVYTNRSSRQTGNQTDDQCNTDGSGSGSNGSNLVKENIMKLLFRCQLSAADTTGYVNSACWVFSSLPLNHSRRVVVSYK